MSTDKPYEFNMKTAKDKYKVLTTSQLGDWHGKMVDLDYPVQVIQVLERQPPWSCDQVLAWHCISIYLLSLVFCLLESNPPYIYYRSYTFLTGYKPGKLYSAQIKALRKDASSTSRQVQSSTSTALKLEAK